MRRTPDRRVLAGALTLLLTACATQVPPAVTSKPSPVTAPATTTPGTSALPEPVQAMPLEQARAQFVRDTAAQYGIDPAYIESVLAGRQVKEGIVAAMSKPAEAKPWRDYRPIFIVPARVSGGRDFLASNRVALAKAEAQYGVPAEIITAIIAVETNFGGNTGKYPVVDALYTLAFAYPRTGDPAKADRENRREAFFRGELAQLFALGKETGMDITKLTGSYAGAMGWGQFMPSSYREFAVDGNGDGKRDLFNGGDDVFASIANYFAKKGGWVRGGPVAVRAALDPGKAPFEPETLDPVHALSDLAARGYRPQGPVVPTLTAVPVNLDGANGPEYWLGFRNFYAITRYNISKHYAMAVYQLSEAIAGREVAPNLAAPMPSAPTTAPVAAPTTTPVPTPVSTPAVTPAATVSGSPAA